MRPASLVAMAASLPLTYAVFGKLSFDADVRRVRADGLDRHGPLGIGQHVLTLGSQVAAMGMVLASALAPVPTGARIALGGAGYAALAGAAALAGVAESRNRLYGGS